MVDANIHVRAAMAHLAGMSNRTFLDDTLRGLLIEIERLRAAITLHYDAIHSSPRGHEASANRLHDAAFGTNYLAGSPTQDTPTPTDSEGA